MMVRTKNPKDRPPNHNMTVGDPQGPDPPGIRKRRLDASAAASSAAAEVPSPVDAFYLASMIYIY